MNAAPRVKSRGRKNVQRCIVLLIVKVFPRTGFSCSGFYLREHNLLVQRAWTKQREDTACSGGTERAHHPAIQPQLQMLQKTHHRVCKTPVKYWGCYIWHWWAGGRDAKPSVCNKNPAAERGKKTITQPFGELRGRCQCCFAEKAFQKKVFQSFLQVVDFYLRPTQSLMHVWEALELFSWCAQNSRCFWFSLPICKSLILMEIKQRRREPT